MANFDTKFCSRDRVLSPSGTHIHKEYVGRYDKNGVLELVPNGETDMYAYIQSFADSVDIHVLMERYANGDTTALSRVQGVYCDVTSMPKTMAEMLNLINDGERVFNSLDVSIRDKFHHSLSEWLAQAGSPDWLDKMGLVADTGEVASVTNTNEEILNES